MSNAAWTGAGSYSRPLLIENSAQLGDVTDLVNQGNNKLAEKLGVKAVTGDGSGCADGTFCDTLVYLRLANDIDLGDWATAQTVSDGVRGSVGNDDYGAGQGWIPIGLDATHQFKSHFDGRGHKISNLYIDRTGSSFQGLFGYTSGAQIKNFKIESGKINGGNYVGAAIGRQDYGTLNSVVNAAKVSILHLTDDDSFLGGLVGYINGATIADSANIGTVYGDINVVFTTFKNSSVGGIVGSTMASTIERVFNSGPVESLFYNYGNAYTGGISGFNYTNSSILNSYNTGNIKGASRNSTANANPQAAGITASNYGNINGVFNTGTITVQGGSETTQNTIKVGGIVSSNSSDATHRVENAVELGETIDMNWKAPGGVNRGLGRIIAYEDGANATNRNNYAYVGVESNKNVDIDCILPQLAPGRYFESDATTYGLNGKSVTATQIKSAAWWRAAVGTGPSFNDNLIGGIWQIADGKLPFLKADSNAGTSESPTTNAVAAVWAAQDDTVPGHITTDVLTPAPSVNAGQTGEVANPFEIRTTEQLVCLAKISNDLLYNGWQAGKYFRLEDNIDLSAWGATGDAKHGSGQGWAPIGLGGSTGSYFKGHFDGNGKTISNLYINRINGMYQGLFGSLRNATVENLTLDKGTVTAWNIFGAVAGDQLGGTINNVKSSVNVYLNREAVLAGSIAVGGLVGHQSSSTTISNSQNSGNVDYTLKAPSGQTMNGSVGVGGIVGLVEGSGNKVLKSFNTGDVSGFFKGHGNLGVGGIAGYTTGLTVTNSYNTGNITATTASGEPTTDNCNPHAGGIVGVLISGTLQKSYNLGNESAIATQNAAETEAGGIVARSTSSNVSNNVMLGQSVYVVSPQHTNGSDLVPGIAARIVATYTGTLQNNFALDTTNDGTGTECTLPTLGPAGVTSFGGAGEKLHNKKDGASITATDSSQTAFWAGTGAYNGANASPKFNESPDAGTWTLAANKLPVLVVGSSSVGLGGQSDEVPWWADAVKSNNVTTADGSAANPFRIYNESQFYCVSKINNGHLPTGEEEGIFIPISLDSQNPTPQGLEPQDLVPNYNFKGKFLKMESDVDLGKYSSGAGWDPIGTSTQQFQGSFDGGNHVVKNLFINKVAVNLTSAEVGLFGNVVHTSSSRGYIKNLGISNGSISLTGTFSSSGASTQVGGIAGYLFYSDAENVFNRADINISVSSGGEFNIGGVVGYSEATLTNVYNTGNITVDRASPNNFTKVGGIVGNIRQNLTTAYNSGNIYISVPGDSSVIAGGIDGDHTISTYIRNTVQAASVINVKARTGSTLIHRITGSASNYFAPVNSYGYADLGTTDCSVPSFGPGVPTGGWVGVENSDGSDVSAADLKTANFWQTTALFGAAWTLQNDKLPILSAFAAGTQDPSLPSWIENPASASNHTGEVGDPYLISTPDQLACVAILVNTGVASFGSKYLKLTEDIDLSAWNENVPSSDTFHGGGYGWWPIGIYASNTSPPGNAFYGNFDGQGHVIKNLFIKNGGKATGQNPSYRLGLFGNVRTSPQIEIKNFGIEGGLIQGNLDYEENHTGSIVGSATGPVIISNVWNSADISDCGYLGGIVGYATATVKIVNARNFGNIVSPTGYYLDQIGGIVGHLEISSTVSNSYNTGQLKINYPANWYGSARIGGIVGLMLNSSSVTNAYNTGEILANSISANVSFGGIVGDIDTSGSPSSISYTYNTGKISSTTNRNYFVGGITSSQSFSSSSSVSNSVSLGESIVYQPSEEMSLRLRRVAGVPNDAGLAFSNNYGLATTSRSEGSDCSFPSLLPGSTPYAEWISDKNGPDGASIDPITKLTTGAFGWWTDGANGPGFDTADWNIVANQLPTLKFKAGTENAGTAIPGQASPNALPSHITAPAVPQGSGPGDEIEISTPSQLACLATITNTQGTQPHPNNNDISGKYFKLTNNIDLKAYGTGANGTTSFDAGRGWIPIGKPNMTPTAEFHGHFDGQGFEIQNLYINRPAASSQGLFGRFNNSEVENIYIVSGDIVAQTEAGSLVGLASNNSTIDNVQNWINVTGTYADVGGIAGTMQDSSGSNLSNYGKISIPTCGDESGYCTGGIVSLIQNSSSLSNVYNYGEVSTVGYYNLAKTGGIAAVATGTSISNSCNYAKVSAKAGPGPNILVGGIAGTGGSLGISDSCNTGDISGIDSTSGGVYSGGLVSYADGGDILIVDSYNTGNVEGIANTGASYVGGIFGFPHSSYGSVDSSFNTGNISSTGRHTSFAGGIAAANTDVYNSSNSGSIYATVVNTTDVDAWAGGIEGDLRSFNSIYQTFNYGSVRTEFPNSVSEGTAFSGGIAGRVRDGSNVKNSVNFGESVSVKATNATESVGRIAGEINNSYSPVVVENNYGWAEILDEDNTVCGGMQGGQTFTPNGSSGTNGANVSSAELKTSAWWTAWPNGSSENYWGNWSLNNDTLPRVKHSGGADILVPLVQPSALPVWLSTSTSGPKGTSTNPYTISNPKELACLASYTNQGVDTTGKNFRLTVDIDLSEGADDLGPFDGGHGDNVDWKHGQYQPVDSSDVGGWMPIGRTNYEFKGSFDGDGHTIKNLYINKTSGTYSGLFGSVSSVSGYPITIQNVGIESGSVTGDNYTAGLIASIGGLENVTVDGTFNKTSITAMHDYTAGIIGYVNLESSVFTLSRSYNSGNLHLPTDSTAQNFGGLVGYLNGRPALISDSYNTGDITGFAYTGGIVGNFYKGAFTYGRIDRVYNTGKVIVTGPSGGIVGYSSGNPAKDITISSAASLGNELKGYTGQINRIISRSSLGYTFEDNVGYVGMVRNNAPGDGSNSEPPYNTSTSVDGADINAGQIWQTDAWNGVGFGEDQADGGAVNFVGEDLSAPNLVEVAWTSDCYDPSKPILAYSAGTSGWTTVGDAINGGAAWCRAEHKLPVLLPVAKPHLQSNELKIDMTAGIDEQLQLEEVDSKTFNTALDYDGYFTISTYGINVNKYVANYSSSDQIINIKTNAVNWAYQELEIRTQDLIYSTNGGDSHTIHKLGSYTNAATPAWSLYPGVEPSAGAALGTVDLKLPGGFSGTVLVPVLSPSTNKYLYIAVFVDPGNATISYDPNDASDGDWGEDGSYHLPTTGSSIAENMPGVDYQAVNGTWTKPADPKRFGYTFAGWEARCDTNGSPATIETVGFTTGSTVIQTANCLDSSHELTLYAKWTPKNVTVTYLPARQLDLQSSRDPYGYEPLGDIDPATVQNIPDTDAIPGNGYTTTQLFDTALDQSTIPTRTGSTLGAYVFRSPAPSTDGWREQTGIGGFDEFWYNSCSVSSACPDAVSDSNFGGYLFNNSQDQSINTVASSDTNYDNSTTYEAQVIFDWDKAQTGFRLTNGLPEMFNHDISGFVGIGVDTTIPFFSSYGLPDLSGVSLTGYHLPAGAQWRLASGEYLTGKNMTYASGSNFEYRECRTGETSGVYVDATNNGSCDTYSAGDSIILQPNWQPDEVHIHFDPGEDTTCTSGLAIDYADSYIVTNIRDVEITQATTICAGALYEGGPNAKQGGEWRLDEWQYRDQSLPYNFITAGGNSIYASWDEAGKFFYINVTPDWRWETHTNFYKGWTGTVSAPVFSTATTYASSDVISNNPDVTKDHWDLDKDLFGDMFFGYQAIPTTIPDGKRFNGWKMQTHGLGTTALDGLVFSLVNKPYLNNGDTVLQWCTVDDDTVCLNYSLLVRAGAFAEDEFWIDFYADYTDFGVTSVDMDGKLITINGNGFIVPSWGNHTAAGDELNDTYKGGQYDLSDGLQTKINLYEGSVGSLGDPINCTPNFDTAWTSSKIYCMLDSETDDPEVAVVSSGYRQAQDRFAGIRSSLLEPIRITSTSSATAAIGLVYGTTEVPTDLKVDLSLNSEGAECSTFSVDKNTTNLPGFSTLSSCARSGYVFQGWKLTANPQHNDTPAYTDAAAITYAVAKGLKTDGTTTLYAIWKKIVQVTLYDGFTPASGICGVEDYIANGGDNYPGTCALSQSGLGNVVDLDTNGFTDGESDTSDASPKYLQGDAFTMPVGGTLYNAITPAVIAARPGWTLNGFYLNSVAIANAKQAVNGIGELPETDVKIILRWIPNSHTITSTIANEALKPTGAVAGWPTTFVEGAGGLAGTWAANSNLAKVEVDGQNVTITTYAGVTVTLAADPTRVGFDFNGWTGLTGAPNTHKAGSDFIMPDENLELLGNSTAIPTNPTDSTKSWLRKAHTIKVLSGAPATYPGSYTTCVTTAAGVESGNPTNPLDPGCFNDGLFAAQNTNGTPPFSISGGGDLTPQYSGSASSSLPAAPVITYSNPPLAAPVNYEFEEWKLLVGGNTYAPGQSISALPVTDDDNIYLVGVWRIGNQAVHYESGSGHFLNPADGTSYSPDVHEKGPGEWVPVQDITPVRKGYTFTGWKLSDGADVLMNYAATCANGTTSCGFTMPANSAYLQAQWVANSINVYYEAPLSTEVGAGCTKPTAGNGAATAKAQLNLASSSTAQCLGYIWDGWKLEIYDSNNYSSGIFGGLDTTTKDDIDNAASYDGNAYSDGLKTALYNSTDTDGFKSFYWDSSSSGSAKSDYPIVWSGSSEQSISAIHPFGAGSTIVVRPKYTAVNHRVLYLASHPDASIAGCPDLNDLRFATGDQFAVSDCTPTRLGWTFKGWKLLYHDSTNVADGANPSFGDEAIATTDFDPGAKLYDRWSGAFSEYYNYSAILTGGAPDIVTIPALPTGTGKGFEYSTGSALYLIPFWEPNQYQVNFSADIPATAVSAANAKYNGSSTPSATYDYSQNFSFNSGYYTGTPGTQFQAPAASNDPAAGSIANVQGPIPLNYASISANLYTLPGYKFVGWNTCTRNEIQNAHGSFAADTDINGKPCVPVSNQNAEFRFVYNAAKTGVTFEGINIKTGSTDEPKTIFTGLGSNELTLHAQWAPQNVDFTYDPNEPSGASVSVDGNTAPQYGGFFDNKSYIGDDFELRSNGYTLLGYNFGGWSNCAAGASVSNDAHGVNCQLYGVGDADTPTSDFKYGNNSEWSQWSIAGAPSADASVTMYAQWVKKVVNVTYQKVIHGNASTFTPSIPSPFYFDDYLTTTSLPNQSIADVNGLTPVFACWSTTLSCANEIDRADSGTRLDYALGVRGRSTNPFITLNAIFTVSMGVTYYEGVGSGNGTAYTSGTFVPLTSQPDGTILQLPSDIPSRADTSGTKHIFVGWKVVCLAATSPVDECASSDPLDRLPGSTVTLNNGNVSLVAQWTDFKVDTVSPDSGSSEGGQNLTIDGSGLENTAVLWKQISVGSWGITCGITYRSINNVFCWGSNYYGELGNGTTDATGGLVNVSVATHNPLNNKQAVDVFANYENVCVITSETTNNLYCWGYNEVGSVGTGNHVTQTTPYQVSSTTKASWTNPLLGEKIEDFAIGNDFVCASIGGTTAKTGQVYCWGTDEYGSLGDGGTAQNSNYPVLVSGSGTLKYSKLHAGGHGVCGLVAAEKAIYCWGTFGLGSEDSPSAFLSSAGAVTTPQKFSGTREVTDFDVSGTSGAVNSTHANVCYIADSITVLRCFGPAGSLTAGDKFPPNSSHFTHVSLGFSHACVLTDEIYNNFYCWGSNASGQINGSPDSPASSSDLVNVVESDPDSIHLHIGFTDVSVEGFSKANTLYGSNCAVTTEHALYCRGNNAEGQLNGDKATDNDANGTYVGPSGSHAVLTAPDVNTLTPRVYIVRHGFTPDTDPNATLCVVDNSSTSIELQCETQPQIVGLYDVFVYISTLGAATGTADYKYFEVEDAYTVKQTVTFDANIPTDANTASIVGDNISYTQDFSDTLGTTPLTIVSDEFDAGEGYTFVGWNTSKTAADHGTVQYVDEALWDGVSTTGPTPDTKLYAVWSSSALNVRFYDGYTCVATPPQTDATAACTLASPTQATASHLLSGARITTSNATPQYPAGGQEFTLPANPVRGGYTFLGWRAYADTPYASYTAVGSAATTFTAHNDNIYFIAQWSAPDTSSEHSIVYTSGDGEGTLAGLNAAGDAFDSASGTVDCSNAYNIGATSATAGSPDPGWVTVRGPDTTAGKLVTLPSANCSPTKTGFTFKGWKITRGAAADPSVVFDAANHPFDSSATVDPSVAYGDEPSTSTGLRSPYDVEYTEIFGPSISGRTGFFIPYQSGTIRIRPVYEPVSIDVTFTKNASDAVGADLTRTGILFRGTTYYNNATANGREKTDVLPPALGDFTRNHYTLDGWNTCSAAQVGADLDSRGRACHIYGSSEVFGITSSFTNTTTGVLDTHPILYAQWAGKVIVDETNQPSDDFRCPVGKVLYTSDDGTKLCYDQGTTEPEAEDEPHPGTDPQPETPIDEEPHPGGYPEDLPPHTHCVPPQVPYAPYPHKFEAGYAKCYNPGTTQEDADDGQPQGTDPVQDSLPVCTPPNVLDEEQYRCETPITEPGDVDDLPPGTYCPAGTYPYKPAGAQYAKCYTPPQTKEDADDQYPSGGTEPLSKCEAGYTWDEDFEGCISNTGGGRDPETPLPGHGGEEDVPPSLESDKTELYAGDTLNLIGKHFVETVVDPDDRVVMFIHSDPRHLCTLDSPHTTGAASSGPIPCVGGTHDFIVDSDGEFMGSVVVPADTTPGVHTLWATVLPDPATLAAISNHAVHVDLAVSLQVVVKPTGGSDYCSLTGYYDQQSCEGNGGEWTSDSSVSDTGVPAWLLIALLLSVIAAAFAVRTRPSTRRRSQHERPSS
jgi:uncharacterized repeat protein (TIGR02543 family)